MNIQQVIYQIMTTYKLIAIDLSKQQILQENKI